MGRGNLGVGVGIFPQATEQHSEWLLMSGFSHMLSTSILVGQLLIHPGVTLNLPHLLPVMRPVP